MGSQMPYTNFSGNRFAGFFCKENKKKVCTVYRCDGYLGHVTSMMLINFHFLAYKSLQRKFGQNGPVIFKKIKSEISFGQGQEINMTLKLNTHIYVPTLTQ